MCFGASASFTASLVLGAIGVATIRTVKTKNEILFASLPVVFAAHQFNEGLLWVALKHGATVDTQNLLTSIYLFIAFLFWPIFSPLSTYLLEQNPIRRNAMGAFVILGILVGTYLFFHLLDGPRSATMMSCGLYYNFSLPTSEVALAVLYLIAAFGGFLLSSDRGVRIIGSVNMISCGIAAIIFYKTFISVWCFFAAALSAMIYAYFRKRSMGRECKTQNGS